MMKAIFQYIDSHKQNEQNVREKLMAKVCEKVDKKEPLFCIGYYLSSIRINAAFTNMVYFSKCKFQGVADFSWAKFCGDETCFDEAEFSGETSFEWAEFSGESKDFYHTKFSGDMTVFSWAKFSGSTY